MRRGDYLVLTNHDQVAAWRQHRPNERPGVRLGSRVLVRNPEKLPAILRRAWEAG